MVIKKIISGGQTGADQAALDFAIEQEIPHGGWITKGKKTERGALPEKYRLQEMPGSIYPWNSCRMNVLESDGTLILSHGELNGGPALARDLAEGNGQSWIHVDLEKTNTLEAARVVDSWIGLHGIKVLNVVGPRASRDPKIYRSTTDVLRGVLCLDIIRNNHQCVLDCVSRYEQG